MRFIFRTSVCAAGVEFIAWRCTAACSLDAVVSCSIDRASIVRECATGVVSNPGPGDAPESATRSPVSAASELRNCGDVINGISAETSVRVPGPREHCSVVKGKGMYGSPAAFTLCSGAREGQS